MVSDGSAASAPRSPFDKETTMNHTMAKFIYICASYTPTIKTFIFSSYMHEPDCIKKTI